ncbi:DUF4936 family protein [Uliginosibacterium sp. H1]|uniref:DUF4936 family protein n=1 Tax=Uliginosibacterium sp. H1 TaxID=3114757 RepID=UPI002E18E237|nr:DUF4936 family protein [Uliginosibacterium sp. H1]
MAEHLYVYYRVAPADEAAALIAVARMFAEIAEASGSIGTLQRRCDDPGTWMECYSPAPPGLAEVVARTAARHLGKGLTGERHVEHFTDCPLPP